jgi:hypothetical protein
VKGGKGKFFMEQSSKRGATKHKEHGTYSEWHQPNMAQQLPPGKKSQEKERRGTKQKNDRKSIYPTHTHEQASDGAAADCWMFPEKALKFLSSSRNKLPPQERRTAIFAVLRSCM